MRLPIACLLIEGKALGYLSQRESLDTKIMRSQKKLSSINSLSKNWHTSVYGQDSGKFLETSEIA